MEKIFKIAWNENELGEEWMNIHNLESCIFTESHTKPHLCVVTEVEDDSQ